MKIKAVEFLVLIMLFFTASSVTGNINIEKENETMPSTINAVAWSDNFDSYTLGQFLDGDPEDGGWEICDCPYQSEGAYVVDNQSLSNPHSVEIVGRSDIIHRFTGIRSGNWTFTEWMYVPAESSSTSAFALDSYRPPIWKNELLFRQLAILFDGENGLVESYPAGESLPLITDQWVELRIEFDLEADWLECYYNDQLLIEKVWTEDINVGTGFRNLACLTLCYQTFNPMETPHYHDDFSIVGEATGSVPDLTCEGSIILEEVKPESTVEGSFLVENIGEPSSRLEWIVEEYPEWGSNWNAQPYKGMLTPEDDPITVEVSFKAPNEQNKEFTGVIKVSAVGDPDDFYEIPVTFKTPRDKAIQTSPFQNFLQSHLNLFPILRQLLELI
jgi:hypothetical protein